MPKIKDIKGSLVKISGDIKESRDIKSLYLWGSFAKNYNNPNFRIRDIDLIASTDFNSGDLISIDQEILTQSLVKDELENQGYNPKAIQFSKNFLKIKKCNIDHWAISSDRKLLHWGPIPATKEESDELNKEASNHAKNLTGYCRNKVSQASQEIRDNWYNEYHIYLNKVFCVNL